MKPSKPSFQSVVDLRLRDVGVKTELSRLGVQSARFAIRLLAPVAFSIYALCVLAATTKADPAVLLSFSLVWMGGLFVLTLRLGKRAPVFVVRVNAGGTNQVSWLIIGMSLLFVPVAVLAWDPLLIAPSVLMLIMSLLVWRGRGRVPEVLRRLRALLATDESVLGDGIGVAQGGRRWQDAFRLLVATDRRLLVATAARSAERLLLIDAPYRDISRFGIEWKHWGRVGVLSLSVVGLDGASDTHVITSIAPANLLSIARALKAHGVHTDDAATIEDAERGWQEALWRGEPPRDRTTLLDRAAMRSREFDRGLWLFLGLAAGTFYLNPFGVGLGNSRDVVVAVLLVAPPLSGICGYVSGTTWSVAYVVPLNLLVSPAFFFADAGDVIGLMVILTLVATVGLLAGSTLRGAIDRHPGAAAGARGSLRYTFSGLSLVRLTGVLLVAVMALVATSSAAGFELPTLRLAIDELTGKQVPVDGRSNLPGGGASLTYTPGPDLHELVAGERWELRSSFTKGYNEVSLAQYVFEPRLDDPAAVADFVARKDREHSRLAGFRVSHRKRVVDGRKAYTWNHGSRSGYWYYAAWFLQPVHSVRIECVARRQEARFRRLCAEAVGSLEFR